MLQFSLTQLHELVHCGRFTSHGAFSDLDGSHQDVLLAYAVLGSDRLDLYERDSGIFWTTVVFPVSEVSQPRLQGRGVIRFDPLSVGFNASPARDGSPLAQ